MRVPADRPLRILHCPKIVGGNPPMLAQAERDCGLDSTCVAFQESPYGFAADEFLWSGKDGAVARELKRWRLLARALRRFDLVHFNFGHSLMPQRIPRRHPSLAPYGGPLLRFLYHGYSRTFESRDLALLKRMGVGIVVTFQGDDARQADYCREHFEISPVQDVEPEYYRGMDDLKRRRIRAFARYADRIYALNPDLMHVLPSQAEFLPYANVNPDALKPSGPDPGSGPCLSILHAPSHRGMKGTSYVLEAVRRLRDEDELDIELILVEGMSHEEAVQHYRRADLVIDQLLAGWYGGFAVEAMALGKPVICYLRSADLDFLPPAMRAELPLVEADAQSLYGVLRRLATTERDSLAEQGRRSREFVERWHHPRKVAARCKEDYEQIAGLRGKGGGSSVRPEDASQRASG